MSYLVLSRKYRPQNFDEVVGQEHVVRTLMSALRRGKVGHSYIFAGPRGVGKTSVARIFAKSLNCEKGIVENPCNECVTCKGITKGSAVDVIEIDGASNRGIDEIRDLRVAVAYTPSSARFKVYIIDEVHMLTKEAFNALLKTLEEPPSHVVFIFATTEPQKVPKTVLSRCQRFDFRMLTKEEIFTTLKTLVKLESVEADEDALRLVAGRAEGSIRDAEGMLDQLISYADGRISIDDVKEVFGFISDEVYEKLFEGISKRDEKSIIECIEGIAGKGYDLNEFVYGWLQFIRSLFLYNLDIPNPNAVESNDRLEQLARGVSSEFLTAVLNLSSEMERDMRTVPYSQVFLELNMLRMARIPDLIDINALVGKISVESSTNYEKPFIQNEVRESKEVVTPSEDVEDLWGRVRKSINEVNGKKFFKEFIKEAEPVSFNNNSLRLNVPRSHKEHLKEDIHLLKEASKEVLGFDINIEIVSRKEPIGETLKENPIIKKVKEIFNAEEYI
ncbi:DNA polymerase III subunit gamma/tau [candidate division WOR-3 bacterium]|nr:DNA polymerase III subunit gamma/tau [candidate division WOR-3 bacterium]